MWPSRAKSVLPAAVVVVVNTAAVVVVTATNHAGFSRRGSGEPNPAFIFDFVPIAGLPP
jgi:hypothetical protein